MIGTILSSLTKLVIGAYPYWRHTVPSHRQRIYFANHASHLDTVAIWSSLGYEYRQHTRPVAAKDYWDKGVVRGLIARQGLNVVLIERGGSADHDPLEPLYQAIEEGDSLIIFPEGTRRDQKLPSAFRAGLFFLSQRYPDLEFVPVYLDNTYRSLPKGVFLPLPFTCTVTFGAPLEIISGETKEAFLDRARQAVIDLSMPDYSIAESEAALIAAQEAAEEAVRVKRKAEQMAAKLAVVKAKEEAKLKSKEEVSSAESDSSFAPAQQDHGSVNVIEMESPSEPLVQVETKSSEDIETRLEQSPPVVADSGSEVNTASLEIGPNKTTAEGNKS